MGIMPGMETRTE